MPYIKEKDRSRLSEGSTPNNPGDLNYIFTMIIKDYLKTKGKSYTTINDILGALEGCKLEFYRRIAVPTRILKSVKTEMCINASLFIQM